MLFIFSTPELIRNVWQLKIAVFLNWCLIRAVPLPNSVGGESAKMIYCGADERISASLMNTSAATFHLSYLEKS
jgi:hypothetical protein